MTTLAKEPVTRPDEHEPVCWTRGSIRRTLAVWVRYCLSLGSSSANGHTAARHQDKCWRAHHPAIRVQNRLRRGDLNLGRIGDERQRENLARGLRPRPLRRYAGSAQRCVPWSARDDLLMSGRSERAERRLADRPGHSLYR